MRSFARSIVLALALAAAGGEPATAEITRLRISFAGGCVYENITGSCSIKTVASGDNLDAERLVLYVSATPKSSMQRASMHFSSVNESGVGRSRLRNRPGGCFQMRTAPNGDDVPDVLSNVICEK